MLVFTGALGVGTNQQPLVVDGGQQDPARDTPCRGVSSGSFGASGEVETRNGSSGRGAGRGNATWDDVWVGRQFPPDGDDAGQSGGDNKKAEADNRVETATKRQQQQQQQQQQTQQQHQQQQQQQQPNSPAPSSASYHAEVVIITIRITTMIMMIVMIVMIVMMMMMMRSQTPR